MTRQPLLAIDYRRATDLMAQIAEAERRHKPRAKLRAALTEERHAELRRELGPKSRRKRAA